MNTIRSSTKYIGEKFVKPRNQSVEYNPYTQRTMVTLPSIDKEKQIKKNIMLSHHSKKSTPVDISKANNKFESSRVYRQQYMNVPKKPHEIVN